MNYFNNTLHLINQINLYKIQLGECVYDKAVDISVILAWKSSIHHLRGLINCD